MISSVFSIDTNCNKLWGMNNEINGVTVSKIGVYMCVDDPLNIYKNAFTTENPVNSELILNENNFDINNFNSSIQDILNNSNVSNIISNFSIVNNTNNILNTSNITYVPEFNPNSTTTVTNLPTTTTMKSTTIPSTTTTSTTTNIQTTTTIPTTTIPTTTIPTTTQATITTQSYNMNKNITSFNKSIHYDALATNIRKENTEPFNKRDDTVTILVITFSILTCCCCGVICFLKREKIKLKSNIIENDVPQLKLPNKNNQRKRFSKTVVPAKTKKTLQSLKAPPVPVPPPPGLPVPTLNNESFTINVNPNKPLTPVNNRRLKFSEKFSDKEVASVTTPKTHEWYKQTFADEINDLQETFSPRQKQTHTHTKVKTINFERKPPPRKKIDKREFNVHPSTHVSPDTRGNFKNPAFRNARLNSWNKY